MEDMTKQIKLLEADIKRGRIGAKKALEDFKSGRVEAIKRINLVRKGHSLSWVETYPTSRVPMSFLRGNITR